MLEYILTVAAVCGLLGLVSLGLPNRNDRYTIQGLAGFAFAALILLGHESTILVA